LITGTTRSGCGVNGSTITSARARYSSGMRMMMSAASTSTPPATMAITFQRRRTAAKSSSIVYVRSIVFSLVKCGRGRESVTRTAPSPR
jgi:hypothetical protein